MGSPGVLTADPVETDVRFNRTEIATAILINQNKFIVVIRRRTPTFLERLGGDIVHAISNNGITWSAQGILEVKKLPRVGLFAH